MSELSLTVTEDAGTGMRLDRYCATQSGTVSRSRLKNGMISVTVNGVPVKMSRIVRPNDIITILWEDPPVELPVAENIPLDIIFENENVTVVNKKQGMVTHPAAGNWTGTLVHALLWRWKETAIGGKPQTGDSPPARQRHIGNHHNGAKSRKRNLASGTIPFTESD